MCDDKLFQQLKSRQMKPKPLQCTQSSQCWCNDLSFRFPMDQIQDEGMSPAELLNTFNSQMSNQDIAYLKTLLGREFVKN